MGVNQVLHGCKSTLKMGLSQGCVLCPILLSVYTNNISCNGEGMTMLRYADDRALVAHQTDHLSQVHYQEEVNKLTRVFVDNVLELNISKSKKLCCGLKGVKKTKKTFVPTTQNPGSASGAHSIL